MKALYFALILVVTTPFQLLAGDLFREVAVRKDSWDIIFLEKGLRYHIKIDDIERGTSGYLQRLRLLSTESLALIEKHSHMDIKPVVRDGKMGIEIKRTYRDRSTGEEKIETTFEPNHKAETTHAEQGGAVQPLTAGEFGFMIAETQAPFVGVRCHSAVTSL